MPFASSPVLHFLFAVATHQGFFHYLCSKETVTIALSLTLEVQKIRNPSWHEMHCEMYLKIKLLVTTVIKNLLFQMHFSVSRPQRACYALKFQMVG